MTDAPHDRRILTTADLAAFLGREDPFTVSLLELIADAGAADMIKLKTVYPYEVQAWTVWNSTPEEPGFIELRVAIETAQDGRRKALERLKAEADPEKLAKMAAELQAQIARHTADLGGPFACSTPAEVRAALIEDHRPVFDEAWKQMLAEAAESLDLAGMDEMLNSWRRTAWLQHDREAYWRMMRDAAKWLAEAGRTPEEIERDLGWPVERIKAEWAEGVKAGWAERIARTSPEDAEHARRYRERADDQQSADSEGLT